MPGDDDARRITAILRRQPRGFADCRSGIFEHGGVTPVLGEAVTCQYDYEAFGCQRAGDEIVIVRIAPAPAAAMDEDKDRERRVGPRRRVDAQLLRGMCAVKPTRYQRHAA